MATVLEAHAVHRAVPRLRGDLGRIAAYDRAVEVWMEHVVLARQQARRWRLMAFGSAMLVLLLAAATVGVMIDRSLASVHIVNEADAVGAEGLSGAIGGLAFASAGPPLKLPQHSPRAGTWQ